MDYLTELFWWAVGNLGWDLLMAAIASLGIITLLQRGWGALQSSRETYWVYGACFVVFFILISAITWRPAIEPDLSAEMLQATEVGRIQGADLKGPIVRFVLSVQNSGDMPSIVKNWRLTAVVDGRLYEGIMDAVPNILETMDSSGNTTAYVASSLVERTQFPIIPGGQATGLLLFNFPDLIHPEFFRDRSPTFTIHFEDVKSRNYTVSQTLEPGKQTTENKRYIPGIMQSFHASTSVPSNSTSGGQNGTPSSSPNSLQGSPSTNSSGSSN